MTVNTSDRVVSYAGNGVTTAFAVTFQFYSIDVYVDGEVVAGADYTVTGGSGSTGTVTFDTAPEDGSEVVILSVQGIEQTVNYQNFDDAPADLYEASLDKIVMAIRDLNERVDRTVRSSRLDPNFGNLDFEGNPGKIIVIGADGAPELATATEFNVTAGSAFFQGLIDDESSRDWPLTGFSSLATTTEFDADPINSGYFSEFEGYAAHRMRLTQSEVQDADESGGWRSALVLHHFDHDTTDYESAPYIPDYRTISDALRVGTFGPQSGGSYSVQYKDLHGITAAAVGNIASVERGTAGIAVDSINFNTGVLLNELAVYNPAGSTQSGHIAGFLINLLGKVADADASHFVRGIEVLNSGKLATTAFEAIGTGTGGDPGTFKSLLKGDNASVTDAAIIMPASVSGDVGTYIFYETGSYSWYSRSGNSFQWAIGGANQLALDAGMLFAPNGLDLGSAAFPWSNAYIGSSGFLDFGNNDVRITHAANTLALTGGSLRLGAASSETGSLVLANASSAFLTTIQAGNAAAARTYVWPTNFGAAGTFLRDVAGDGVLSWEAPAGGGDALTTGTLAQFAATTSAQLAGVISDETGSGPLVFANGPVFNESGADVDLRMEGDTDANLFFLDASADCIGIGVAAPSFKLDVGGNIRASTSADAYVVVNAGSTFESAITFPLANSNRWTVGRNNTAESGSNAGSDFIIRGYNDAGVLLGTYLTIARATGNVTLTGALLVPSVAVDDEAYDATGWNGDLTAPTKNAVRDYLETLTGTTLPAAYQPLDADLTTWAGLTPSANAQSLVTAANYAAMRALLDLEAGTDFLSPAAIAAAYQPLDADLTTWAGLTPSANAQSLVTAANYAAMRALLDLEAGTDFLSPAAIAAAYQPLDATLTDFAAQTIAADKLVYGDAADSFAVTDFTSVARTLVAQTTQALMRTTGLGMSANGSSLVSAADYAAMRALLDLEAGTDFLSPAAIAAAYQPLDADLTSWAAVARASGFDTFVATPSSANLASLVTDETGSGPLVFATSPTLTTPRIADGGFIADANGNELLIFTTTASAVNELTYANGATGVNPKWTASGETNVGMDFQAKGTGVYRFLGTVEQAAQIRLYEDTTDGSNYSAFRVGTQAGDIIYTLPTALGSAGDVLTDLAGDGVLSWEEPGAGVYQPLDGDLTAIAALATTAYGRGFLVYADEAAFKAGVNLEIGTDVQAYDADLTTWAGLTPSANAQSLVTAANYAAMRALLDLEAGTDFYSIAAANAAFQPLDATLTDFAAQTIAADKLVYGDAADSFAVTDFTSVARTLVAQTTQALMRTTGLGMSANGSSLVAAADYAAMKALLDLEIGTDVQAYDADLTTWAGLTPSANAQSLVTAANYAAMRALLDLEAGTDFLSIAAIAAAYQPLDADLTSWAGVTRASGFDTFVATPSAANLRALLTDEANFAREVLTANRTYYVRTDGSDSNTGLADSAGGAFLTLQKAWDVVQETLDLNGYDVTIDVQGGSFSAGVTANAPVVGGGSVTFLGDAATPTNILVSTTSANCFSANYGATFRVRGVEMRTTTGGNCLQAALGGTILFDTVQFGACAGNHIESFLGGQIYGDDDYTISGNAGAHLHAYSGGLINLSSLTGTLTGTPAFTNFFVGVAVAHVNCASVTWSGAATGSRFTVHKNGQLETGGGGLTYFPGNAAGTIASGGVYDSTTNDLPATASYSPTATPGGGAFTTHTVTGQYVTVGKFTYVSVRLQVTNVGTATGHVDISLPNTSAQYAVLAGRANGVAGLILQGLINPSGTAVRVWTSGGAGPLQTGEDIVMSGWYENT
jgi:hypothetical protein